MGVCVDTYSISSVVTPPGGTGVTGIRDGGREFGLYVGTDALGAGAMGASSEGVGAIEVVR